uniref:Uncharacterized protein n=1 Tax=Arundo donax TaxID=35708 RepID=A0A0A8ZBH6_ARUDO
MKDRRTSSSAAYPSAAVRLRQMQAATSSNREQRMLGGARWRSSAISRGPKKNGMRAMSPGGVDSILSGPPAGSRYSRCGYDGCGGCRAKNISLPHAGVIDGFSAPQANSQMAFSNCMPPGASTTQWQNRCPKMKPPHLSLVT